MRPDVLVVYGDRYEAFAAMITGTQMNVPTAHIEGGDYTEGGALDDSVRHAMTKLAHLHFATNEQAVDRILRLGEEPWRVHNVGQPSLDLITAGIFAQPDEIASDLKLDPARPVVLFCQHSVTTEVELASDQVRPSIAALTRLAKDGFQVVITYPNNDAGGRRIVRELEHMRGMPNVNVTKSLGRSRFHGVLNLIGRVGRGCFAGNSSALIKETPAFGCPGVNIGSRQQGRLRGGNILDVDYDESAIYAAIRRSVEDDAWRRQCQTARNPYGAGDAGRKIAEVLSTVPIDTNLLRKKMTY
jgi:UDP-N-acetylglucosamine 2-epimerase (non-hydrolysing)/GDP/UDP-N,N'-diacetylbacillosamine 2-epimerase (hydrolysing)